jgi:hypothetical protein
MIISNTNHGYENRDHNQVADEYRWESIMEIK